MIPRLYASDTQVSVELLDRVVEHFLLLREQYVGFTLGNNGEITWINGHCWQLAFEKVVAHLGKGSLQHSRHGCDSLGGSGLNRSQLASILSYKELIAAIFQIPMPFEVCKKLKNFLYKDSQLVWLSVLTSAASAVSAATLAQHCIGAGT